MTRILTCSDNATDVSSLAGAGTDSAIDPVRRKLGYGEGRSIGIKLTPTSPLASGFSLLERLGVWAVVSWTRTFCMICLNGSCELAVYSWIDHAILAQRTQHKFARKKLC